MEKEKLDRLMRDQAGVVSRTQVLAAGHDDNDIERWIRRREWARIHEGVYVDHTGELTWLQAAWAAVLFHWPAALCHQSAMAPSNGGRPQPSQEHVWPSHHTGPDQAIHVAIDRSRRGVELPGVRLHRIPQLDQKTLWNLAPPRMRLEEAVLDVAASRSRPTDALAVVADACQSGRTTPARLIVTMSSRRRMRHGTWLRAVLQDVAQGVRSVLEHGYLVRVERAHGLPRAQRQAPGRVEGGGSVYRDVEYPAYRTIVELDGRLGHEWTLDRWADLDRDIDAQAGGSTTIRLSWSQVFGAPCRTARAVARVLALRGWDGAARSCGPECALAGRTPAPGADDLPRSGT
jgi:hypothetical protein